ncbi:MAG: hypothetical protein KGL35_32940 [Bradyrhizobium sp.]|nr:hypothetical protein [Bradyrhizobium sp.]
MSALQTTAIEDLYRWEDEGGAITHELVAAAIGSEPAPFYTPCHLAPVGHRWIVGPAERPLIVELVQHEEGGMVGRLIDATTMRVLDAGSSVEHPGEFLPPGSPVRQSPWDLR